MSSKNRKNVEPELPDNLTIEYSKTLEVDDSDDYSHGSEEETDNSEKFEKIRKFLESNGLTNDDLQSFLDSESNNGKTESKKTRALTFQRKK